MVQLGDTMVVETLTDTQKGIQVVQLNLIQDAFSLNNLYIFCSENPLIACLLHLIFLDIITGIGASIVTGELSSVASYKGMVRKAMVLGLVATAKVFSIFNVIPGVPWGQVVAGCFCITEAISITENVAKAGVPIPKSWRDVLLKLKQQPDKPPSIQNTIEVHSESATVAVDSSKPSTYKRKSDVNIKVRDSGAIEIPQSSPKKTDQIPPTS